MSSGLFEWLDAAEDPKKVDPLSTRSSILEDGTVEGADLGEREPESTDDCNLDFSIFLTGVAMMAGDEAGEIWREGGGTGGGWRGTEAYRFSITLLSSFIVGISSIIPWGRIIDDFSVDSQSMNELSLGSVHEDEQDEHTEPPSSPI